MAWKGWCRAERYFRHEGPLDWRFTDPDSGARLIRIAESVKQQRHIKIRGDANPFDPLWDDYFAHRDRKLVLELTPAYTASVLRVQDGICPWCWQIIGPDDDIAPHYRDGNRRNYALANMVYYHPSCHPKTRKEPFGKTWRSRPFISGVCHA